MIYLSHFSFPGIEREYDFILGIKRTCYDSVYPFQILSRHGLQMLDFEPVTILYGGNGSGKTTALNVMAEKLGVKRDTPYNRSNLKCGVRCRRSAGSSPVMMCLTLS